MLEILVIAEVNNEDSSFAVSVISSNVFLQFKLSLTTSLSVFSPSLSDVLLFTVILGIAAVSFVESPSALFTFSI
jgi:hypothetical protein